MKEIETVIASNIIELRARAGMTQLELAEKLCYSDKSVSKWERAESIPDVLVLKRIAEIFGVTIDYLLYPHDKTEKVTILNSVRAVPHRFIIGIAMVGIVTLALLLFIILWLTGNVVWKIFVYMIPIMLITLLVLHTIWANGKYNAVIVALLVASLILTLYVIFLRHNWWQIFLLLIPAEAEVILSFALAKRRKKR